MHIALRKTFCQHNYTGNLDGHESRMDCCSSNLYNIISLPLPTAALGVLHHQQGNTPSAAHGW